MKMGLLFLVLFITSAGHAFEPPILALSAQEIIGEPYKTPLFNYDCKDDNKTTPYFTALRASIRQSIQTRANLVCKKEGFSNAISYSTEVVSQPQQVVEILPNLTVVERKVSLFQRNSNKWLIFETKKNVCPQSEFNPQVFTSLTCK